jgi:hypothetical protein
MAAPSFFTERTSTQTSEAGTPCCATSRSASAATAWTWARSDRQRQKATWPPAEPWSRFSIRPGVGCTTASPAWRMRRPER